MTEAEKNEIVGLVMTQISSQAVDFDIETEQPQANDLLTAVRQTSSGAYAGVTIKWDDVARIATELANQAATRAEQAKTNVENMKASVEQTVTDFNALAEQKKQEVQGVYQSDLNELKGDLVNLSNEVDETNSIFVHPTINMFDSTDSSMVLSGKSIDAHTHKIIDESGKSVIKVPIYDKKASYALLNLNSAHTAWVVNTLYFCALDKFDNYVTLPTAENQKITPTDNETYYLCFNCSDTVLNDRQPMIIKNWDGVNKTSYVAFSNSKYIYKIGDNVDLQTTEKTNIVGAINEINSKVGIGYTNKSKLLQQDGGFFYNGTYKNVIDENALESGLISAVNGEVVESENYSHTPYIDLSDNNSGYLCAYKGVRNNFDTQKYSWARIAFYDENKLFISGISNASGINNLSTIVITVPIGAKYTRIAFNSTVLSMTSDERAVMLFGSTYRGEIAYTSEIPSLLPNDWANKKWGAYGDSITAITNGNDLYDCGWASYVNNYYKFANFYGRGIGGQKFNYDTNGGGVAFINSDGTLQGRNDNYNKDNYTGTVPTGTTACRGAFCSWDRITHMFPSSIKDTIDMVFVMGGTNDGVDDEIELSWVVNNNTDTEWANSAYYSTYGGDYNINTLRGGIASTVMKIQAWMPNAIIILGTPLNGGTHSQGNINPALMTNMQKVAKAVQDIAQLIGIPFIDVFGTCGINGLNSPSYITDGVHPYNVYGNEMIGRAVIGGLKGIIPRVKNDFYK